MRFKHLFFKSIVKVGMLLVALLASSLAEAHKVNMFAYVDGDHVFIEGYFSDGNKARNSAVAVYNPAGDKLLEGETGEDGTYSFKIPGKGPLRVTLNAGMGHKAEYTVSADELAGEVGAEPRGSGETGPASSQSVQDVSASPNGQDQGEDDLDLKIRRAVGDAIKPLMRSMSELEARRGFSDIVGGIGFIVGILGTVFYFKARKLSQGKPSESGS